MHVAGIGILEPGPRPPDVRRLRAFVKSRLADVPLLRRRVVRNWLGSPGWEDVFPDIAYHVRGAALPKPGGMRELADLVGWILSTPLDLSRPPWELWLVEGLDGGRMACVLKVHHCAVDGVSLADLVMRLFGPQDSASDELDAAVGSMLAEALPGSRPRPLEGLSMLTGAIQRVRKLNRRFDGPPPPSIMSAPRTSINGAISGDRVVAFRSVDLEDVRMVSRRFAATSTDVVLAMCAGSLRRYLISGGELPDEPLVAMLPIATRRRSNGGANNGAVSIMLTSLATDLTDPAARLMEIRRSSRRAARQHLAIGPDTMPALMGQASGLLGMGIWRLYSDLRLSDMHAPVFNVVVTWLPGPPESLSLLGAPMTDALPAGPIGDGIGLNVTAIEFAGRLSVGLVGCRNRVAGIDRIADGLTEALAELKRIVLASPKPEQARAASVVPIQPARRTREAAGRTSASRVPRGARKAR